ncbi:alpha/beta hydrolase [Williamsia sterculiae]|nr:alpha/beta hydrolase family protein [Williamsia sterculiae]
MPLVQRSLRSVTALSALAVALLVSLSLLTVGAGTASAWGPPGTKGFRDATINGYGMDVKTRVRTWASQTSNPKTAPTVIFLDGLRATNDVNGWEKETNVAYLSRHGYNVVMPVGGQSSFYEDWNAASPTAGQRAPYRWRSVLTKSLPAYLNSIGFSGNRTLVGLSMAASSAVMMATDYPQLYKRAVSMSGFMHLTAPGMQTMLRAAAFDAGRFDLNNMYGIFPNISAFTRDPTLNLPRMAGKHFLLYAGTGAWGGRNPVGRTWVDNIGTGLDGSAIEVLSMEQSRTFALAAQIAGAKVRADFPAVGIHSWGYWQDEIWNISNSGWFFNG